MAVKYASYKSFALVFVDGQRFGCIDMETGNFRISKNDDFHGFSMEQILLIEGDDLIEIGQKCIEIRRIASENGKALKKIIPF